MSVQRVDKNKKRIDCTQSSKNQDTTIPSKSFVDNRSEALFTKTLQQKVHKNPHVTQFKHIQNLALDSSIRKTQYSKKNSSPNILPKPLKSGIEYLSGLAMDDVNVHYNSNKPTQLRAHAYAQGTNIHLASGQEKHLPHEAWHVVQQKQGRVKPTVQMKSGVLINDDTYLEKEADMMGTKALLLGNSRSQSSLNEKRLHGSSKNQAIQRMAKFDDFFKTKEDPDSFTAKRMHNSKPQQNADESFSEEGIGMQRMGLGELRTKVSWGGLVKDKHGSTEGTHMIADPLGPDHKKGSVPGDTGHWILRRKALSAAAGGHKYVAGHLLNHNLGGSGRRPENLAAIPDEINKAHSNQIEEHVKGEINTKGGWGRYEVKVQHSMDQGLLYASNFRATWIPYTITADNKWAPANTNMITADFNIPAPSAYAKASKPKEVKAPIKDPTEKPTEGTVAPFYTPLKYDEVALTANSFKVIQAGYKNVILIRALKARGQDVTDKIAELKQMMANYEVKLEAIESEKLEQEATILEQEEEIDIQEQYIADLLRLNAEATKAFERQIVALEARLGQVTEDLALTLGRANFTNQLLLGESTARLFQEEGLFNVESGVQAQDLSTLLPQGYVDDEEITWTQQEHKASYSNGYNKYGLNPYGYDKQRMHVTEYLIDNTDWPRTFDEDGLDRYGFNRQNRDEFGYDFYGKDRLGIHMTDYWNFY